MRNLKQLLGLCEHQWEIFSRNFIVDEYNNKIGMKYHLQCKKCGSIKVKRS